MADLNPKDVSMLCPFCQQPVAQFAPPAEGGAGLRCPLCGADGVPALYPIDYDTHPAVPFSIIGPSGHGKTVFIEALLTHLERHVRWPGYAPQWMDQAGMRATRDRLRRLRGFGELPDASVPVFPRPQVLRLRHVPRVGGCQLVFYDTGGEAFRDAALLQDAGRYVRNSAAVVWLVSLTELEYPEVLTDQLTVYAEAMAAMGADPRKQTVVVVLTKGDLLIDRPDLPPEARDFLLNHELDPAGDAWVRLEAVSAALERWLQDSDQRNFVHLVRRQFRAARFCVLSAQGGDVARDGQLQMELAPRGVLAPLFWLWRETLPVVWVEAGGRPEPYFTLPEAAAAARSGATIRLNPGTFPLAAPLELRQSVRVVGAGPATTTITSAAGEFAVGVGSYGTVAFEGLSFVHTGSEPADVVRVLRGTATFTRCQVRGGAAGGTVPGDGVRAVGPATVAVTDCTVGPNQGNGISTRGEATLTAKLCRARGNGACGVFAAGAAAEVAESWAVGNTESGVRLGGAVRGSVLRTSCNKNGKYGIVAADASVVELRENTCGENVHGIALRGMAAARVSGNKCLRNLSSGIAVVDKVTGEVTGNECVGNVVYGVGVEGEADLTVAGNRCTGNQKSGISYSGAAAGACTDNTSEKNRSHGVRLASTAGPEVDGNRCARNGGAGFHVAEGARPRIGKRNVAEDNAGGDFRPEKWGRRGWLG